MGYEPGERNISERGVKELRLASMIGFFSFLVVSMLYPISTGVSAVAVHLGLAYFAFYCLFQAEQSFCGTHGILGLEATTRGINDVEDEEHRRLDMGKGVRQNVAALSFAAFFVIWSLMLSAA